MPEKSSHKVNRLKTAGESLFNLSKAAIPLAIAAIGLNTYGINLSLHDVSETLRNIVELAHHEGPFITGLTIGAVQNAILIGSTLMKLDGKTEEGTLEPSSIDSDGTHVYQLACVDKRRADKSGGAIPGSFGPMGAEFVNIAEAMVTNGVAANTPGGDFMTGYFIGSNILTTLVSHVSLLGQVVELSSRSCGNRTKIEMVDHWQGCGAEGFTNPMSFWAKFKAHQLTLADIIALPNEIAGYIYVNGVLNPLVALLSGGKVSLSAGLRHSDMHETVH